MTRSRNHSRHVIQQYLLCTLLSDMVLLAIPCDLQFKALFLIYISQLISSLAFKWQQTNP